MHCIYLLDHFLVTSAAECCCQVVGVSDCLAAPAFPEPAAPNATFVFASVGGLTGSTDSMDSAEFEFATASVCKNLIDLGRSLDAAMEPQEMADAVCDARLSRAPVTPSAAPVV